MKRHLVASLVSVLLLVSPAAWADFYSMVPSSPDLGDLDHYRYYTWGVDTPWPQTEAAAWAALSFTNIRNWTSEANVLYVHLLENAPAGVTAGWDNQGGGDAFQDQGVVLTVYHDLSATAQTLRYIFTEDQIAALNAFAADGRFALGFDPDCHFLNDGVQLEVATEVIPEPAALAVLALGGGAIILGRRAKRARR